jgi:hypothetical protein
VSVDVCRSTLLLAQEGGDTSLVFTGLVDPDPERKLVKELVTY